MDTDEEKYTVITRKCRWCDNTMTMKVIPVDYARWMSGTLIQKAMPYLTDDEREMLISQTCGPCWDKITGSDE